LLFLKDRACRVFDSTLKLTHWFRLGLYRKNRKHNFDLFQLLDVSYINFLECVKCDFRGAELRAANLGGADLSNAKLSYADLRSANLNDVIISCADLRGADLSNARLNYSDFQEADLSNARLSYADLRGVNLWWTKLPEKLSNAVFKGAKTGPVNTWRLRGKL